MNVLQNQISAVLKHHGGGGIVFPKQIQQLILGYFYSISNKIVYLAFLSVISLSYRLYHTSHRMLFKICSYAHSSIYMYISFKYRNLIKYT